MTEDMDFVREWVGLELARKQIFREAWQKWEGHLKSHGHTKATFDDVEAKAMAMTMGKPVQTEYGMVLIDKTPIYEHRGSRVIGTRDSLTLQPNKETR